MSQSSHFISFGWCSLVLTKFTGTMLTLHRQLFLHLQMAK